MKKQVEIGIDSRALRGMSATLLESPNGTMKIPLTNGAFAIIDSEDFPIIAGYIWFLFRSRHNLYAMTNAMIKGKRTTILMHRLILSATSGQQIDHRNRNGLMNMRSNLRFCTVSQNARNHRLFKNSTSGFKGVWWDKTNRNYVARLYLQSENRRRRFVNLGRFPIPEEAAHAYDAAAIQYFGEFASPNFNPKV